MKTSQLKQEIVDYIEHADKETLQAIFHLLKPSMIVNSFELSDEEVEIMDKSRADYLLGKTKGYNLKEARKMITSKR